MSTTLEIEILSMEENRLRGSIPDQLGSLAEVNILGMSHNEFSSTIPEARSECGPEGNRRCFPNKSFKGHVHRVTARGAPGHREK